MDAFLRRVVKQREKEQFAVETDAERSRWLTDVCDVRCAKCGKRAGFGKDRYGDRLWVCIACGGWREAQRLERRAPDAPAAAGWVGASGEGGDAR